MFNKTEYWKNKKAGKRGQGEQPEPKFEASPGQHMVKVGKGFQMVNREQSRRKLVDRTTTKKGFVYGVKIGSKLYNKLERAKNKFAKEHKGERVPSEEQRIHLENHPLRIDPTKSNHQRMLARKEKRDAENNARRAASSTTPTPV